MKLTNFFKNRKFLYLLLFLAIFSYFLWLNNTPNFSDPDAFYHAKIVDLIRQQGIIYNFYWLPFTTLSNIYIDHHLLYHLILVPFSSIINSLLLVKIAAVFFASSFIIFFQWLLDKLKIKYSFLYTLLLLISHQFIFRLNLVKVSALSLLVLLFLIYILFTRQKKWSWPLFILSFLYVWLYGGWVIGLFLVFLYTLIVYIFNYLKIKNWKLSHLERFLSHIRGFFTLKLGWKIVPPRVTLFSHPWILDIETQGTNWKLFLSSISGFLAGLIINPYFPTNLKFYWQQTLQIGLINYKNIVDVGGEWYGLSIFNFIQYNPLLLIIFFTAIVCLFIYRKQYKSIHWFLFVSSLIFFVLTLKSQRNIEYFVPLSLLFSALVFNKFDLKKEFINFKNNITHSRLIINIIYSLLILYLPIIFLSNYQGLKSTLSTNYSFNKFKNSMFWLKNNTQPGDIIFYDRWDNWPVFFYYNSYNRYIVGLDPTFMYFKDKQAYSDWRTIIKGEVNNPCQQIKKQFNTNYIFISIDDQSFKDNLDQDIYCKLVYEDQDGFIYRIN